MEETMEVQRVRQMVKDVCGKLMEKGRQKEVRNWKRDRDEESQKGR